ncbi:hypothetical protein D1818_09715 [Aquimarina sp. BL5]|uniref:hypothetical protein n=1 Tax=Aquimarina sp. BL5 TaxID=1714860 RepID=UPI000E4852A4|nr:hypothetical protein [Aquimarina sp. BL5]AXT51088.1 hypothetical protein D1818_09715 [Aquimarina sp. BL5]RKN06054.1 hypothetical protein D7036_09675 [Aquimarina sp. BL5]
MNREEFYNNLIKATNIVYPFTSEMVLNELPDDFKYIVKIYSSFREGLEEGEMTFPDVEKLNQTTEPIEAKEVIEMLWMDHAIPEWINIQVEDYDENYTYFSLECCGRYSKLKKHLYHIQEGYPPFHSLSPPLPYHSMNKDGKTIAKFDINRNKK